MSLNKGFFFIVAGAVVRVPRHATTAEAAMNGLGVSPRLDEGKFLVPRLTSIQVLEGEESRTITITELIGKLNVRTTYHIVLVSDFLTPGLIAVDGILMNLSNRRHIRCYVQRGKSLTISMAIGISAAKRKRYRQFILTESYQGVEWSLMVNEMPPNPTP